MTFSVNFGRLNLLSEVCIIVKNKKKSADVGGRTFEREETKLMCSIDKKWKSEICRLSSIMQDNLPKYSRLSGVIFVILTLISDNVVQTDVNFRSNPTTVKTYENDSVLLPCYSKGSWCFRAITKWKWFTNYVDFSLPKVPTWTLFLFSLNPAIFHCCKILIISSAELSEWAEKGKKVELIVKNQASFIISIFPENR